MIRRLMHTGLHVWISCKEKVFKTGDKRIKYLLQRNKRSNVLLVVFSGFSTDRPTYNYIRTLWKIRNVNKLFILDDFGYKNRGSYYLMENGDDYIFKMCTLLIQDCMKKLSVEKLYCAGSSKGGTAAIIYGCELGADAVISGAPQYYIGDYLDTDDHRELLRGMLGASMQEADIASLNQVVEREIEKCIIKPEIFLHYSPNEHTYAEHICFLIEQLRKCDFVIHEDIKRYTEHSGVADYYGTYLCQVIGGLELD